MNNSTLKYICCLIMLIALLLPFKTFAVSNTNNFKKLYSDWTAAFNRKDLTKSCDLFAKNLTADYRGYPTKNYQIICNGFKKIFKDQSKQYHYDFKIKQVYQSGDLAAVRIVWYLTISKDHKKISTTKDEGLDILQKNKLGEWKIVNYLGYS